MTKTILLVAACVVLASASAFTQARFQPDWGSLQDETMQHFQALFRFDTTDPTQERILEGELHRFVRFNWDVVVDLAQAK